CMRTRSQARNRNRRQQQLTTVIVEEPEFPMADNRTMAQMLQAPIEGYEDAIVVPTINANNFELKQTLINLVQSNQFTGKQDPHNHLRFFNKVWICQISQEISQKRTRERMSDQEAKDLKAEAREIMPQPSTVNCKKPQLDTLGIGWQLSVQEGLELLDSIRTSLDALDSAAWWQFLDKNAQEGFSDFGKQVKSSLLIEVVLMSQDRFFEDKMTIKKNPNGVSMKALVVTPEPVIAVEEFVSLVDQNHNFNNCPVVYVYFCRKCQIQQWFELVAKNKEKLEVDCYTKVNAECSATSEQSFPKSSMRISPFLGKCYHSMCFDKEAVDRSSCLSAIRS
ncbi:hypothetical protein Tco_0097587, partial [Tanacetum coccineum]